MFGVCCFGLGWCWPLGWFGLWILGFDYGGLTGVCGLGGVCLWWVVFGILAFFGGFWVL